MPDTARGGSSNLDTPRSPLSISTDSSGSGSLKPVHSEKTSEPPTPVSPAPLTRKRAASLNTETANLPPRIGYLALNSASSNQLTSDLTREQVCLCQPDPKIPRPRNAFILYRQHYQAQVVAQHPGLANPEISKIIGEQWREQAPEVKNDWKILAEEEKQRHQRQYPGYRYQPRRAGKANETHPASTSSSENPTRCPKCGGRYISTPSTPHTPFTPDFGPNPRKEPLLPAFSPATASRTAPLERPRYSSEIEPLGMNSPRTAPPHTQTYRRVPYPHHLQTLHTYREQDEDMDLLITSPEQKRRRFNNEPQHQRIHASSSPVSFSTPQSFSRGGPMSATGYRQQQLPAPGLLARPVNMGPPPQQSPMMYQQQHQYSNNSSNFDESLRLPPLQTQVSTPTTSPRHDPRADNKDRRVEAMVMNIPYTNKIKLLCKVSPPLKLPGFTSPATQVRGAVVAVEGADKTLVAEIGDFINEYLRKEPSCGVQTWGSPESIRKPSMAPASDTEMADTGTISSNPSVPKDGPGQEGQDLFVEYLSVISEWHKRSQEITKYITNAPPLSQPSDPSDSSSTSESDSKILPVALLPRGFSLSISDDFASRIPIMDSYAPVDHWQWMATLWRGIIGPDLTVYTKRVNRDEMERIGGVEMRVDCRGIIVRVLETEKMDEKTARRLGFEVMESVRGVEIALETRHEGGA